MNKRASELQPGDEVMNWVHVYDGRSPMRGEVVAAEPYSKLGYVEVTFTHGWSDTIDKKSIAAVR